MDFIYSYRLRRDFIYSYRLRRDFIYLPSPQGLYLPTVSAGTLFTYHLRNNYHQFTIPGHKIYIPCNKPIRMSPQRLLPIPNLKHIYPIVPARTSYIPPFLSQQGHTVLRRDSLIYSSVSAGTFLPQTFYASEP